MAESKTIIIAEHVIYAILRSAVVLAVIVLLWAILFL